MRKNNRSNSTPEPGGGKFPAPPYCGNEPYIYVCYSYKDFRLAFDEIRRFQESGYYVWYDDRIVPSNGQLNEIETAISNCSLFVILITPNALNDVSFQKEIGFAFDRQIPVLQIYLKKPELPPSLEMRLGAHQAIIKENTPDEEYEYRITRTLDRIGLRRKETNEEKLPKGKGRRHHGSSTKVDPSQKNDYSPKEKKSGFFSSLFSKRNKLSSSVALSEVQFSAVAPESLKRSEYSIIDIMMYEEEFRYTVDELIAQSDTKKKETKSGVLKVKHTSKVSVILSSPDIAIDDNDQNQQWNGGYLRYQFVVMLPDDYEKTQILFNADIYINDVIATKLKFTVSCEAPAKQKPSIDRTDILSAFVSYASQDRSRVATVIQGMSKARPDLDIFFDIESLRSGENWETILMREIDMRDLLFLCWSENAKNSEWVDYEWRYAYKHKGIEHIEPIPLESPEKCPPPRELSVKHFNDKLLYIINSSNI